MFQQKFEFAFFQKPESLATLDSLDQLSRHVLGRAGLP